MYGVRHGTYKERAHVVVLKKTFLDNKRFLAIHADCTQTQQQYVLVRTAVSTRTSVEYSSCVVYIPGAAVLANECADLSADFVSNTCSSTAVVTLVLAWSYAGVEQYTVRSTAQKITRVPGLYRLLTTANPLFSPLLQSQHAFFLSCLAHLDT